MARAYSDDLRRKLLEAHAAGKGTLRELAERFGVSVGWAFKISAARRLTGAVERVAQRCNKGVSKINRAVVGELIAASLTCWYASYRRRWRSEASRAA